MKRRKKRGSRHFLVQHDLASLLALPGVIWNIAKRPKRFDEVEAGDKWVGYAYIKDERACEPCSLIVGFYRCVRRCRSGSVPLDGTTLLGLGCEREQQAWMIEGEEHGRQPRELVLVPRKKIGRHPIESLLGKRIFRNQTLVPLKGEDFDRIQSFALREGQEGPSHE